MTARLVARDPVRHVRGTQVMLDLRPLQESERMPITSHYLRRLLEAFADQPLDEESFTVITRLLRPDPSEELERRGLRVRARRRLPPTGRLLRSAALTLDSFLLRGAEIRASTSRRSEAQRAVYHTAGGAVPLASQLPVVATLLDLAPWEMPDTYAASPAARLGHRLRARVLHDAARIIVCSRAIANSARRRLHLPEERLAIVPLAVDASFRAAGWDIERATAVRARLGLPPRYMVMGGRYDARKDFSTAFEALVALRRSATDAPPRAGNGRAPSAPPTLVLALHLTSDMDRDALQRAVERSGAAEMVRICPPLTAADRAGVIAGAEAFVYPSLSEGTGLSVLEALSLGVPVITSRVGAPPEFVGSAGIVVEPRDPRRLAAAIAALASDGALATQLRGAARARAAGRHRTWADVAAETRAVYAAAAASRPV